MYMHVHVNVQYIHVYMYMYIVHGVLYMCTCTCTSSGLEGSLFWWVGSIVVGVVFLTEGGRVHDDFPVT